MLQSRVVAMAALTALAVLGACAPRAITTYVAPTDDTVLMTTEMSMGSEGQSVYVANNSTVPIVVTGLHLYDCENIKNRCEPKRINMRVDPGRKRLIETVRSAFPARSHSFRVRFTWTAEGTNPLVAIPPR